MARSAIPAAYAASGGYRPLGNGERARGLALSTALVGLLMLALIWVRPPALTKLPRAPSIFAMLPIAVPDEPTPKPQPQPMAKRPDPGSRAAPRAPAPMPRPAAAATPPAPAPPAPPSGIAAIPAPVALPSNIPSPPPPSGAGGAATTITASTGGGTGGNGEGAGKGRGTGIGDGLGDASTLVRANWARETSWQDIYALHPREAKVAGKSGKAELACQVTLKRRLVNCTVRQETPGGWGFGVAALRLVPQLRALPRRIDGREVDLAWVSFTINFDLPRTSR
ncbi:hypothetical protein [Sphingomonas sp.]|uniref:hypothetical protein n=1 Tax=Sphingomonas sp. TaxID=28214 RepID=UPI001E1A1D20|nr:hypothetical protein [Sphingomonas sp.]MBX9797712.1 energy transducer TonB [Sphingomonas sp.]